MVLADGLISLPCSSHVYGDTNVRQHRHFFSCQPGRAASGQAAQMLRFKTFHGGYAGSTSARFTLPASEIAAHCFIIMASHGSASTSISKTGTGYYCSDTTTVSLSPYNGAEMMKSPSSPVGQDSRFCLPVGVADLHRYLYYEHVALDSITRSLNASVTAT